MDVEGYQVFAILGHLSEVFLRLYGWLIVISVLMTWVQPDRSNVLVRWVFRVTEPFIDWVGGWLPRKINQFRAYLALLLVWNLGRVSGGMLSSFGLFLGGELAARFLVIRLGGYFAVWILSVLSSLLGFLILLLLIWFVLTLIRPSLSNRLVQILAMLVDPFISPVQKRFSSWCWIGRVDISPLLVLLLGWVISFAVDWLIIWGYTLSTAG